MNIDFHWIGGATFILTIGSLKIACDPVLCPKGTIQNYFWFKSERIEAPVYKQSDFEAIDIWLITHNHEDHLDEIGLSYISQNSTIISNQNAVKTLEKKGLQNILILNWAEVKTYYKDDYKLKIEAIPAVHGINPVSARLAGKVNGYFLTVSHKSRKFAIYITSDTVYKKRITNILKDRKTDLLIPNMGAAKQGSWIMTLTLNTKMLSKLMSDLKPKIVIPVHFGTFSHYKEPVEDLQNISDKRINILKSGEHIALKWI